MLISGMKTDRRTGVMYTQWSVGEPVTIFLLVHGFGAHSGRWKPLSDYFLYNSISSYAIELKGFGETNGMKGHIDSLAVYFRDLRALRKVIIKENRDKKIFLIGESIGAVISFLAVIAEPRAFDGLICISPAFANRIRINPLEYAKILYSLIHNPKRQFTIPFTSEMCTRDKNYQRIMDEDVREHRLASAKLLFEIIIAQIKSRILSARIALPVLFLLSGDDKLVDPGVSKKIFRALKTEDKTLLEYPGMYHALSIDLGRERVFGDMLEWVKKRI